MSKFIVILKKILGLIKALLIKIKEADTIYTTFFVGFMSIAFIYFYFIVKTPLIFQAQKPVFFFNSGLFVVYAAYPGGLVEYFALLLNQFYYFPVAGAVLLAFISWAVVLFNYLFLKFLTPQKPEFILKIIPGFLMLAFLGRYHFPLSLVLGLLLSLAAFYFGLKGLVQKSRLQYVTSILMGILLYYLAGGFLLLYIIGIILFHALISKELRGRIIVPIALLIIPVLTAIFILDFDFNTAFLKNVFVHDPVKKGITPIVLYVYYLLLVVYIGIFKRYEKDETEKIINIPIQWLSITVNALLVVGVMVYLVFAMPGSEKKDLSFEYYTEHGMWKELLDLQYEMRYTSLIHVFATNRALYHTGELLHDMLAYPQVRGNAGLFMVGASSEIDILNKSDYYFELGMLDEALDLCKKALVRNGDTPWILKRIALINIALNDSVQTVKVLNSCKKSIILNGWARRYAHIAASDSLRKIDPVLRGVHYVPMSPELPEFDLDPQTNLEFILAQDSDQKMALEYLLAHYLSSWNFEKFLEYLPFLKTRVRFRYPRHIQEALILINEQKPFTAEQYEKFQINMRMDARYATFRKRIAIFGVKHLDAAQMLKNSFGDTYWYYALYPPIQVVEYDKLKPQVNKAIRDKEKLLKTLVKEYESSR